MSKVNTFYGVLVVMMNQACSGAVTNRATQSPAPASAPQAASTSVARSEDSGDDDAQPGSLAGTPLKETQVFTGKPGCHLACYTHDAHHGGAITAVALVRVEGKYNARTCIPKGHENADISAVGSFKTLCHQQHPDVCPTETACWMGGDTGGWFWD